MPAARLVLVALVVSASGCSSGPATPTLYPLIGTVTRDGKPVVVGGLIFVPDGDGTPGLTVNAVVQPDGSFAAQTLRTSEDGTVNTSFGAPAGIYTAIYHPPGDGSKTGLEVRLDDRVTVSAGPTTAALVLPKELPEGTGMPREEKTPAAEK
jgi:hypothetical protein